MIGDDGVADHYDVIAGADLERGAVAAPRVGEIVAAENDVPAVDQLGSGEGAASRGADVVAREIDAGAAGNVNRPLIMQGAGVPDDVDLFLVVQDDGVKSAG